jgi:secreted trypsin-like serine protease
VILTNGTPLLVGIVSWGKKACAGDGRPGVYTRIDRYAQWIDQAMKLPPGKNRLP